MTNMIFCQRLKQDAQALEKAPFPGDVGQRILENISKKAWSEWLTHQTMLINENRLSMIDVKSRQFLKDEMIIFLFSGGAKKPDGYTPIEPKDA
tara:strand:- start:358 stop:639 length:282 start_codon:yes stop_codon:yes gene_type:complete